VNAALAQAGGWLSFDAFMHLALYQPGCGYYTSARALIGPGFGDGSDFVTAPALSPVFARTLARAVAQWMQATGVDTIWEFGAGRGSLAAELLAELDRLGCGPAQGRVRAYVIMEVSAALQAVQAQTLTDYAGVVTWAQTLPEQVRAVVLGNEVLDAMPVKLLNRVAGQWCERGVVRRDGGLAWEDRPSTLRPPLAVAGEHDYLTEVNWQAQAWVRALGERLKAGVVCLFDYGFPEHEYYHAQRAQGTLMCHQGHRSDADPLCDVGNKDITAHVDFTAMAVAAQAAGLGVVGYTSQGSFLLESGLVDVLPSASVAEQAAGLKLVHEHEMGELFKVLVLAPERSAAWVPAIGFARGDRTHTL
jgi:SAM-dependent MidA family methyltransferase